jgi:hypothetical protein
MPHDKALRPIDQLKVQRENQQLNGGTTACAGAQLGGRNKSRERTLGKHVAPDAEFIGVVDQAGVVRAGSRSSACHWGPQVLQKRLDLLIWLLIHAERSRWKLQAESKTSSNLLATGLSTSAVVGTVKLVRCYSKANA